jgi:hypothetical protein
VHPAVVVGGSVMGGAARFSLRFLICFHTLKHFLIKNTGVFRHACLLACLGWLIAWLAGCLAAWWVGWLVGWLVGLVVGLLVGWLVGWVGSWFAGRLVRSFVR